MYKILSFLILASICISECISNAEPSTGILRFGNSRTGYINQNGPVSQPSCKLLRNSNSVSFLLENGRIITGDREMGMICISNIDGELFWSLPDVFGPFSISNGIVYTQYRSPGVHNDTHLIGVNIENGEIVWRWNLKEVRSFLVENNVLYTVYEQNLRPSKALAISTLDSLGSAIWEVEIPRFHTNSISLHDNVLILALEGGGMRTQSEGVAGISAISGELLWTVEHDSIANHTFPMANNAVFIRSPKGLQALSTIDGSVLWTNRDSLQCDPSVRENSIFYISGNEIVESSLSTGERLTSQDIPGCSQPDGYSISLAENGIFMLSRNYLLKLNYELAPDWLYTLFYVNSIIIYDGKIYYFNQDRISYLTDSE